MGLAQSGTKKKFISVIQKSAQERLDRYREKFREEPDDFLFFILNGILERVGLDDVKALEKATAKKAFNEKWPVEKVELDIKVYGMESIGFGSLFSELTEKMYRNTDKNNDTNAWPEARAYGVAMPEKPSVMESFEEREKSVLLMVALYAQIYYPELLDTLDFRKIVEEEIEIVKGKERNGINTHDVPP